MRASYRYYRVCIGLEKFDEIERSPKRAAEKALKEANPPPFYSIRIYEWVDNKFEYLATIGGA